VNEAETRAELIDPAIKEAGWGAVDSSRVGREVPITLGRLQGAGRRAKPDIADYVLYFKNEKLAVIEAKRRDAELTEGATQAKNYADKLHARFAYSTNGRGIYRIDMQTGKEGEIDRYPTPEELWNAAFSEANTWRDRFAAIPFEDKGGFWKSRYYQDTAVSKVLDAIAQGKDRVLLTMATGTGKTFVAFQIAWKLFQSRWNLSDWKSGAEPSRRPRILFLADRNILADQAYNAFSAFPEDALVRIAPDAIRKKGRVPTNGSIFFTIFQTFMSGRDADGNPSPSFGGYSPDFFDFIIIDECHRGGAKDESRWRGIMDYFKPAVQLGLTATPLRRHNADTYAYFGKPVYVYSLKEGINDGFLTPFKVQQIATTLDDYTFTTDDELIEGEVEEGERFAASDFNITIEIKEREKYRVKLFMDRINQNEKTLVFCANQAHALLVRDLVNQAKTSTDPNYCVRVTADEGENGERQLRAFQDNEKTIPTILTTSQKLSTGVDARNVRNIVLMRSIKSMIEFKQIIGRGTRLFDGKDYFTIYDFEKAYEHFNDPDWDGEPAEPEPPKPRPPGEPKPEPEPTGDPEPRPEKVRIRLSDGKVRSIQHMTATSFWSPDGKPISAKQFVERLYGDIPALFKDEDELRAIWSKPDTRRKLLEGLEERGYGREQLEEVRRIVNAERSDLFDVLAYIAYAMAPKSREERVIDHRDEIYASYADPKQQEFLDFVLNHYIDQGDEELNEEKLPDLLQLKYASIHDATEKLGAASLVREMFVGFQKHLYSPERAQDDKSSRP